MKPEFIIYQKFNEIALANDLAELLDTHDITYFLEVEAQTFNPAFSFTDTKEYVVKVRPEDFEQINKLLKQTAKESIGEVEPGYYLLDFTNAELMEVVAKADEWSAFDVQLARKLLAERGNVISDEEIEDIEEKRIEELKEPEPSQLTWVVMGYIIAICGLVLPFFISVIGLFIGWHLSNYKKTLPDGSWAFGYNDRDRKHGKIIFYTGLSVFLVGLVMLITGTAFRGN